MILRLATLLATCTGIAPLTAAMVSNVGPDEALAVIPEHEPVVIALPLRNPYDHAVKVVDMDSTCECNRLEVEDTFLLPHQETVLHFEFDNDNRSGPQLQRVWLDLGVPEFSLLEVRLRWEIQADVVVDSLNAADQLDARPADTDYRDIYGYTAAVRPDELHRLRHVIRVWSPPEQAPEGGFAITGIDNDSELWAIEQRARPDGAIILIATAAEGAADVALGEYEDTVTVHTNHPDKPSFELVFYTAIDPEAGRPEGRDPARDFR